MFAWRFTNRPRSVTSITNDSSNGHTDKSFSAARVSSRGNSGSRAGFVCGLLRFGGLCRSENAAPDLFSWSRSWVSSAKGIRRIWDRAAAADQRPGRRALIGEVRALLLLRGYYSSCPCLRVATFPCNNHVAFPVPSFCGENMAKPSMSPLPWALSIRPVPPTNLTS